MANVLPQLNVSVASSSSQQLAALSSRINGPRQSSAEPGIAIGAWMGIWNKAEGPWQNCSLRRKGFLRNSKTGPRFQSQISGIRLEHGSGVSIVDSGGVDLKSSTPSSTANGVFASATQRPVNQTKREKAFTTDSAVSKPMDMERRGAAEDEHPYHSLNVAPRWREIQGEKNWNGMLDPMDPVLRGEIIRYGEFAQATYDAFDYDSNSPHGGSCKYHKRRLLKKVGLENRGYEVTDYFYATAGKDHAVANFLRKIDLDPTDDIHSDEVWDPETNWIGFIAVCTDRKEIARLGRRDIVIVWRGTVTKLEWLQNLTNVLVPSGFDPKYPSLKVEAGFLQLYTANDEKSKFCKRSAREKVIESVISLVHQYRFEELSITVTGHSLGSALAMLCAYDLAVSKANMRLKPHEVTAVHVPAWEDPNGLAPEVEKLIDWKLEKKLGSIPITVFSFAGPRVGNDAFRDRMEDLGIKTLRVVNKHDLVPRVPGLLFNESFEALERIFKPLWRFLDSLPWTYTHAGVKLEVDNLHSLFLKTSKNPLHTHNLEAHLHLVDGYHGPGREFKPVIGRDIALVNKGSDLLRPKWSIPPFWYQEENKGLIRDERGRWVPRRRDPQDLPEKQLEEH